MANVKISALPQQYSTTLDDVLAIVDSGNTLTSKVALSTIYQNSGSTVTSATRSAIIAGKGDIDGGNDNGMLAVQRSGAGVAPKISGGVNTSAIIASWRSVNIQGGGERNAILTTEDSNINAGFNNTIIGSTSSTNIQGGYNNTIIGSSNSNTNSSNTRTSIIGGSSNSINTIGSNDGVIVNTKSGTISFGNLNAEVSGMYNSVQSDIFPQAFNTSIYNSIYSQIYGNGARQDISNSSYGYLNNTGGGSCSLVLNSNEGKIHGGWGGQQNAVINSSTSQISGTSNTARFNTIIGSSDMYLSTASGNREYVTVLGVAGTKAITWNNTTYNDNSHTYKVMTNDVINVGGVSGTINVDLSLGTLYKFVIQGDLSITFTNWREGASHKFFVYNDGTWTISSMAISGGGSVYTKSGSLPNPTNNGRTLYTATIMEGDIILTEDLDYQAV